MVSDTVGDFIIRLKNAGAVKKNQVNVPYSKLKHAIAETLKREGYLAEVEVAKKKAAKVLEVSLRYTEDGAHAIAGVKRISKPGRRLYIKANELHPVKFGKGRIILSTPAGILTGEEARAANVGGEQLFIVW